MRTCFSQIFWGLLLVILDISINGFDLLPDGIGYLIVAAGCRGLLPLSPRFLSAAALCVVLAVFWLIGFVTEGELAMALGLVTTVVNCLMMWQLLGGIAEFSMERGRPDLAERASNRRLAYVVIMIGSSLLAMAMHDSPDAAPLVLVLVLSMVVLMVMILHLIHRVKFELAG